MKKSISLLIAIVALSAFVACGSAEKKMEAAPVSVTGKGMVSVLPAGAGFVIEAEGGKKYSVSNPDKLDKKLQKNKAKVEFTGITMKGADGAEKIELTSAK